VESLVITCDNHWYVVIASYGNICMATTLFLESNSNVSMHRSALVNGASMIHSYTELLETHMNPSKFKLYGSSNLSALTLCVVLRREFTDSLLLLYTGIVLVDLTGCLQSCMHVSKMYSARQCRRIRTTWSSMFLTPAKRLLLSIRIRICRD